MILSIIKNHCKRVWKGEEAWWKIACVWVVMSIMVFFIISEKLWQLGIMLVYTRGLDQMIVLGMWIAILLIPLFLISYTLFLASACIRKKIKPYNQTSSLRDRKNTNKKHRYLPDFLIISLAVLLSLLFKDFTLLTAALLLIPLYSAVAFLTGWWSFLTSNIRFIYKFPVFLVFPVTPIILGSLNYSGFCIPEGKWYSEEEKIHQVVKYINTIQQISIKPPHAVNWVSFKRIPYATVDEFLAKNPGCCKIRYESFRDYKSAKAQAHFWKQKLTGFSHVTVTGEFKNFYTDTNGNPKNQLSLIYAKVRNCRVTSANITPKGE